MNIKTGVAALAVLLLCASTGAEAQHGHFGGGGGFHGGYRGGYYGGRVGIGIGLGYPYYGYWGPYGYYPGYYPDGYYAPTTVYATPAQQSTMQYWYFCPPANAYYPYVNACPTGWQAVPVGAPVGQPAKPAPVPQQGQVTFSLGDVLFATNSADLRPESLTILDKVIASIRQTPDRPISIEGHTDNRGGDAKNLDLSQRRADAVKRYLAAQGIEEGRISAIGRGKADPVAPNGTAAGRQRNRRVDIVVG